MNALQNTQPRDYGDTILIVAHPGFRGDENGRRGDEEGRCVEMTRLRLLSCNAFT